MQKVIATIGVIFSLGCTSPERDYDWYRTASLQEKWAHYQKNCIGYGYEIGTDDMRDCMSDENRAAISHRDLQQSVPGTFDQ